MENASKALIIAGAILLSILIISLGIMIFNNARDAISDDGLDDLEIAKFNSKFLDGYEGTKVRGSKVNTLLQNVLNHNLVQEDESTQVEITGDITLDKSDTVIQDKALNGNTYTVTPETYTNAGRIEVIKVEEN